MPSREESFPIFPAGKPYLPNLGISTGSPYEGYTVTSNTGTATAYTLTTASSYEHE